MFIQAHEHYVDICPDFDRTRRIDRDCDYRWPDRLAKHISDKVHRQVQHMLGESRLTRRNENDIQLIQPGEIFSVDRILGSGAFSQVSAVTIKDGRRYACKHLQQKLMERPQDFQLAAAELALEAHILSAFDHPNILKIRGWAANGIASFECGKHDSFFLMLDLLDETLEERIGRWRDEERRFQQSNSNSSRTAPNLILDEHVTQDHSCYQHLIHKDHNYKEQRITHTNDQRIHTLYLEKIRIMTEIASALDYIHAQGVVFRDLKPQNIGFSAEKNSVQIFDFGLSRELPSLDTSIPFSMSGKVGTLRYMAPEVATNQPYNISSDVYSWAIVSYELLSLEKPFDGWTRDLHEDLVCNRGIRPETRNTLYPISDDMKLVLERAWSPIPSNRGTMSQIGAQLQCILSNQMAYLADQQQHLRVDYEPQQQQQEQFYDHHVPLPCTSTSQVSISPATTNGFYIDNMPVSLLNECCSSSSSPLEATRISRSMSFETIETIYTSSLSVDSFRCF
eukprot:CAMPEP_0172400672 /NCGR_PEP_ID=MMETSP1061-20121228/47103_1 /TAXON_ID=37318 /ORGANISM="Pseudo-nitzschia pungens, Strain cf. pungens" /LENGTH=507 /DNA_ID=CAMNT_0013134025 /DNA_START=9 /DNA_END=1532 /DNA_ORIENTATION=-